MNEARQQRLLASNTALAKKVFEFVPIQEAWTAAAINTALRTNSSTSANHIAIRGCIGDMKDQGLIREVSSGLFQRTPVSKKMELRLPKPYMENTPVTQAIAEKPVSVQVVGTLDQLAQLSSDVKFLVDEINEVTLGFVTRLQGISTRIEEVALQVESEREVNEEAANKLRTLQNIFLSINTPTAT